MNRLIRKNAMRWIFKRIRRRIPAMGLLTICNIISAYLSVRFAFVTRELIDGATSVNYGRIVNACITLVIFVAARTVLSVLGIHISEKLSYDMERDFKQNVFHTVLNGDYSGITKYHTGDLINRMGADSARVYSGLLSFLSSATGLITSLVTAMVMLTSIEPGFMIAMACGSAVIALLTLLIQRKMKQLQLRAAVASGRVTGYIQESISKLLIIQALDVSSAIEKRADTLLEERWQIHRERKNITILMNIASSLLAYAGSFAALLWGAVQLYHGSITFGSLTATTQLVTQLQGPMMGLPKLIPQLISITTAAERLMELEDIPSQSEANPARRDSLYAAMTGIRADHLTFAYDRDNVLNNVSFIIPKGGLTVITGSSGIGKSTLLKLMLGIYRPNSGELCIDYHTGCAPLSRATRRLFSYAPQGNLLLSGTLRDNLLLSKADATERELQQALYVSAMDEYVFSLPQGLDTALGENAAGLSEGQAQRLSLARAVLSGAPILLLDEVTSSLDPDTEQLVLRRISRLEGRTCIAVTHRPAILDIADYRLNITESGAMLTRLKH